MLDVYVCTSWDVIWSIDPDIFWISKFAFRPHISGESGIQIRNIVKPLSREKVFEYAIEPLIVWRVLIGWRSNLRVNIQHGRLTA